jgi:hypothetical protein
MMPLSRKIGLALVGVGLCVLGASFLIPHSQRPVHAIDAVPPSAFLSVAVDVARLRKSPVLGALFGDRDEQKLAAVCGFDPLDVTHSIVFALPVGGSGDFGVAVQADIKQADLLRCADAVVKAHGGDPTVDQDARGPYKFFTPHKTSAGSDKPPRSIGYHEGDPILVGPKRWLFEMVDALEEAGQGRPASGQHTSLLAELDRSVQPPPAYLLTATVRIEPSVRAKLRAEMLAEVGGAQDPGTAMMLGVLGMSAGVLGLYERDDDVRAVLDLRCEEEGQCVAVGKLVEKVRAEWAKMDALREFGLGPVLDHLEVSPHDKTLEVRAGAPSRDILRWARLYLAMSPFVAQPGGGAADVPTETLKIPVPEGLEPGQPFTVKIPAATSGSAATGTRNLVPSIQGVVPSVRTSPSAAPAPSSRHP